MTGAGSADVEATEHQAGRARVRALDGLRGLAVAAVLAYHVAPGAVPGGFLGVDAFFVLSGFLLTSLLVDEHRRTDGIDRRAYASRRLRRLGPGLLALLATLIVVVPILAPGDGHRLRGDIASSIVGLTNWHLIADGSSYFTHLGRPPFVQHLWSVAVEIQFYVLCPWLVGWLARRRRGVAIAVVGIGIAASATAMAALYQSPDPSRAYFGTDARMGALLVGMLLALLLARPGHSGVTVSKDGRSARLVGPLALAAFVALTLVVREQSRALYPVGFLVAEGLVAMLIAVALRPGPLASGLGRAPVRWLGQRSYGIYLWHWPVVILLRPGVDVTWPRWVTITVTIALSLVLGELSFRLVERPFLRRRQPARRRRALIAVRSTAMATAAVALAVVLIRVPTTDNIAASLHAGERVVANDPFSTSSVIDPASPTTAPPSSQPSFSAVKAKSGAGTARPGGGAAPAYAPHLSAPAPGSVPVTAIGDSVMLGAANALQARLGSSGHIDARVGRQFDEGIKIAHDLRVQGRLGRVAVIHLGNNGPVRASQVDAMMRELDPVATVLLVTVRVDASWQNSVNQTFHDAEHRFGKLKVVDWYAYSAGHGEWFWSDHTHLRPAGASAYADLVAGSIPPPPPPPPPPSTTTTSTTSTTAPPTTTTSTTAPPTTTSTSTTSTTLLVP
jgi:peptidoglycan/LPS O-acetylase OafA/YrhL